MDVRQILRDKTLRAKQRKEALSAWIQANPSGVDGMISFAREAEDSDKASCVEALEFATRADAALGTKSCFEFAVASLAEVGTRVKWEAAKVVGNIARRHAQRLDLAIARLLDNAKHESTVVRWSAAFALGEILLLETAHNASLVPAAAALCEHEHDNAIRKFYVRALKKLDATAARSPSRAPSRSRRRSRT